MTTLSYPDTLEIEPLRGAFDAEVAVPGSKSLTNRALLVAALAGGTTRLENALFSDDSYYFTDCLQTLGFGVTADQAAGWIEVEGLGGRIPAVEAELFVGLAGTAARFLTAFVGLGQGSYVIDGVERMRQRPMGDLLDGLHGLGVDAESLTGNGCLPVRVRARGIEGGTARLAAQTSSQFLTALLLIGPAMQHGLDLIPLGDPIRKPYLDMTLALMEDFGVRVERDGYSRFTIAPGQHYRARTYPIEPDASAASYFFAAAAVTGGRVRVPYLGTRSRQGDIRFVDVLEGMGCHVERAAGSLTVQGPRQLQGIDVEMNDISDTALTLAAIAPFASSPVTVRRIAHARQQECDRVAAGAATLRRLGIAVDEAADGWTIYPGSPHGAELETYDDHRVAMSFAITGLRTPGIRLRNPGCVAKTFPDFFERLALLMTGTDTTAEDRQPRPH